MTQDQNRGTLEPDDKEPGGAGGRTNLRLVLPTITAVVLLGWAISAMGPVLIPLATSILITLAVIPVRDAVRARVPDRLSWLGVMAAVTVLLLILAAFAGVLVLAAQQIVGEIPVPPGQVVEMIQSGNATSAVVAQEAGGGAGHVAGAVGEGVRPPAEPIPRASGAGSGGDLFPASTLFDIFRRLGGSVLGLAGGFAAALLNSIVIVAAGLILVIFLSLLLLAETGEWEKKVSTALSWPEDWRLTESADVIAEKMRAYLLVQAGLGLISALLYFSWLWIWGVGLLLVWPLLIFVLNFIPTIGSLVGGSLPVFYTLFTRDLSTAIFVGLGIVAIEQLMGNLVGPRVQGHNIALSPFVILLSLVFWGWAWGIAGALLAVPVTVALVVLGAHIPVLRPWALLLSNRTGWAGLDDATRPE